MADKIYYELAHDQKWAVVFINWFKEYAVCQISLVAFLFKHNESNHAAHYHMGLYYTFANALLLCADRHPDIPNDTKDGLIIGAQELKGVLRTIMSSAGEPLPEEPPKFWEGEAVKSQWTTVERPWWVNVPSLPLERPPEWYGASRETNYVLPFNAIEWTLLSHKRWNECGSVYLDLYRIYLYNMGDKDGTISRMADYIHQQALRDAELMTLTVDTVLQRMFGMTVDTLGTTSERARRSFNLTHYDMIADALVLYATKYNPSQLEYIQAYVQRWKGVMQTVIDNPPIKAIGGSTMAAIEATAHEFAYT